MKTNEELMRKYHAGLQKELTDEERDRLYQLPEWKAERNASLRATVRHAKPASVSRSNKPIPCGKGATSPAEAKVKEWPSDILNPEGLLGEVVAWIRESSGMFQPKFALAAGLTACGSLLGRIVKDYTGQRTNLYTLAIGNSSAGKDDPIKSIQKLMLALDRRILLGGEVTSDSALEILLDVFPSRIMLLDEVGHYLANVKSAGQSNGHLKTVMPMLTKAWSSAHSALQGKARALDTNAKWKPPKTIIEPCVSVYGTTVPNVLFDSMSYSDFADGSIPRFLAFISESRPEYKARQEIVVPDGLRSKLLDALHQLGAKESVYLYEKDETGEKPVWNPTRIVSETPEASEIFAAFETVKTEHLTAADRGDQPRYLYGKAVENARRVALIVAALRNPSSPTVDQYAADYAVKLVTHSVNDMIGQVRLNVANSKRERGVQDVVRAIRRAGAYGITQSDLTRATRSIRRGDRDDIILDLIEAGTIKESEANGRGAKSVTVYRYLG